VALALRRARGAAWRLAGGASKSRKWQWHQKNSSRKMAENDINRNGSISSRQRKTPRCSVAWQAKAISKKRAAYRASATWRRRHQANSA